VSVFIHVSHPEPKNVSDINCQFLLMFHVLSQKMWAISIVSFY